VNAASVKKRIKGLIYPLLPVRFRFTHTYRRGGWKSDESVSGPGSTLAQTESIRSALPEVFAKHGVRSLLDAPCGDFHWMNELLKQLPRDFIYHGADIVAPLIESVRSKYATANVDFTVADLIRDPLPKADAILCRDCWIHFSERDIRRAVENLKRSGARLLLTTSFTEIAEYTDIQTGRCRLMNLERAPFNFPEPLVRIREEGPSGRFLGVWDLQRLPSLG
jgi:SAM-dependent methyltransferase